MDFYFVLTFENFDKSAFHVCGITQTQSVVDAWKAAGDDRHKAYRIPIDKIMNHNQGYEPYDLAGATPPF